VAGALFDRWLDPRVDDHLIVDEGEVVIDEVTRHWVVRVVPAMAVLAGAGLLVMMPLAGIAWWFIGLVASVPIGWGLYRIQVEYMDRFVITNMRVFRVHGLFNQQTATVPISRILDISVRKPLLGRIFGYGHFTFESAAQDQGLRDIRYVGRPDERDLTIQRVIQRSGLRKDIEVVVDANEADGF